MPRKVLLITADQFRFDHLGCTGHPLKPTPNLDGLAAESSLFLKHFTNAIPCGPSRASLHTGLYACNHRSVTNGTPLDRRHTNLALEVRKAGIEPLLYGYSDTSVDPRRIHAKDPSLDTFESILPGFKSVVDFNLGYLEGWLDWLEDQGYERPDPSESVFHHSPEKITEGRFCDEPAFYAAEHSDTAYLTHHACHTIRNHRNEDWFIHLSLLRPHPPLIAPAPYNRLYNWRELPLPERGNSLLGDAAMHPLLELWQQKIDTVDYFGSQANMLRLCDEDILRAKAVYLGLITEVDKNLGKIFDLLKETGQWDDTLIIFTSDHGEQLGDHHLWGKGGCFDSSWHIPLILRNPKIPASHGITVSAFSEHVDITPTILAWLDQEIPLAMDGRSLLPNLQAERLEDWKTGVFCEFDWRSLPQRHVERDEERRFENQQLCLWRDDDFKYVHFAKHPPLLFDLKNDPHETTNLAENPAYLSVCNKYLTTLLQHRMRHSDRNLTLWQLTDDQ